MRDRFSIRPPPNISDLELHDDYLAERTARRRAERKNRLLTALIAVATLALWILYFSA